MKLSAFDIKKTFVLAALMVAGLLTLLRTAWIGDDALISMRCVLNFLHGWGPTFNIDERVQAFTHPLWFALMSMTAWLMQGRVMAATYILSFAFSLGLIWLLLTRATTNFWAAAVGVCALIFSKAWVDYATSGLENPLSHLLIVAAALAGLKALEGKSPWGMSAFFVLNGLLYLTRPDLLVMMLPLAIWVMYENRKTPWQVVQALGWGLLLPLAWTAFSVYYYGFPLANTVYAKMGCGIPLGERVGQGCKYFLDSLLRDPLTLLFIIWMGVVGFRQSKWGAALVVGGALYMLCVLTAGGDFMSGRFFTAPLVVAVLLVARSKLEGFNLAVGAALVLLVGAFGLNATLLSPHSYENSRFAFNGIADERGFYYQKQGLWTAGILERSQWEKKALIVFFVHEGGLGEAGISMGPGWHIFDSCALADPLLARLPAKYNPHWRVGHFIRQLPAGYMESLAADKNLLTDPDTKNYYESLRRITRGPLNAPGRWQEILKMNLGLVKKPSEHLYRYEKVPQL